MFINWQLLIGHPVSSAAASNQSIHSIHPVHHHSHHHHVIHNDVVDDDEVLIIKFHSPFIISIYEPLSRIMPVLHSNMINIIMKSFFSQISVSIFLWAMEKERERTREEEVVQIQIRKWVLLKEAVLFINFPTKLYLFVDFLTNWLRDSKPQ